MGFASKPLFYRVMTSHPLELFRKFFGAVRAIFWLCESFLAPECSSAKSHFQMSPFKMSPFKLREANCRGVSKPGCFPLFSGKVQIVSRTLSGLFLVGALNRPRKRKRANRENPRTIPKQIGKIPGKSGKSQKGQKGQKVQKRKDKSRSGNPPV